MLAKLEQVYLGILRVVILVAATVALLVAGFGLASAIPPLIRSSGLTETSKPNGGTLAEFIAEQKITETVSDAPKDVEAFILPDLKAAAKILHTYLGQRTTTKLTDWEKGLQSFADEMPGHSLTYATSVLDVANQLKISKGKPLSEERVAQLVDWHKNRFEANVSARAASEVEANARFWLTLGGAGAAFLAFVLIIFIFLFVKIERSLRLVHTTSIIPPAQDAHE
ncbi:hypothetical protein [Sphingomonas colocasiae]|uniref:DUF2937 family protein n=1 Tax=Sphingomonas colocasiae TaxID=1848973 RepID=A0ABS7PR42_9SPHN|nr:hypothetical protein [Sphingomonas colocasiae]MBY8823794.1 hypothetical protein [Sphingomonas colocasiae]